MKVIRGLLSYMVGTRILGETPKEGDVYVLDGRLGNPFAGEVDRPRATVLEVRRGWVKYKIGRGLLSAEYNTIRSFLTVFSKVPETNKATEA